jgi:hypothetical protein
LPNAEAAVALAPGSAVVHAELGHTLVILQRKEEVEHAFSKSMQMAKAHPPKDQTDSSTVVIASWRQTIM